jgi:hypothetical protein
VHAERVCNLKMASYLSGALMTCRLEWHHHYANESIAMCVYHLVISARHETQQENFSRNRKREKIHTKIGAKDLKIIEKKETKKREKNSFLCRTSRRMAFGHDGRM